MKEIKNPMEQEQDLSDVLQQKLMVSMKAAPMNEKLIQGEIKEIFINIHKIYDSWIDMRSRNKKTLKGISNLIEQLKCCRSYEASEFEDEFPEVNTKICDEITNVLEEDFTTLVKELKQLDQPLKDVKKKLKKFEETIYNLDWDTNNEIITGSATQPKLSNLLDYAHTVISLFFAKYSEVSNFLHHFSVTDEDQVKVLENIFEFNWQEKNEMNIIIAQTSYIVS